MMTTRRVKIFGSQLSFCISRNFITRIPLQTSFGVTPAPPRLDKEEQEEFERLNKLSALARSSHNFKTPEESPKVSEISEANAEKPEFQAKLEAEGDGRELHPDIRRGAEPEFYGDVNPHTGEIGGPKNEPLRWGSTGERGDWSYNGRVTDF
ncbi:BgTH12-02638 [Blumeria graminis f. sp. triticale]|uniref:Succinate dehydrogenase assembly factor 4, mitochondrial n=3 Tax=Blumeria graminis TaxID=34373 RepID=A0A381LFL4_BLUGR|nr:hypothetical protein BGT96224_1067 [Blumeria graminis f. sp. tritici 96224]CAD6502964.1 BgTH12-02638 [Blumeria graminis f. sp. triticale]VDB88849.1 Bgt-1067 [Blumeria graminis f. sp. tritici]